MTALTVAQLVDGGLCAGWALATIWTWRHSHTPDPVDRHMITHLRTNYPESGTP